MPSLTLLLPLVLLGHGGTPQVRDILFPSQFGHAPFAVTDNQGIYGHTGDHYRWLCEDVVLPRVGLRAVAILGEAADRWLLGTLDGLMASSDRGCNWAPVDGPLGETITSGLWPHPKRPLELLAAAASFDAEAPLQHSTDGGATWIGVGPTLRGTASVLRAVANPDRVFLNNGEGAFRSDDGRSFEPIKLGPDALGITASEFRWLATSPVDSDVVFAVIERLPTALVLRSGDAGESWVEVLQLQDFPRSMVLGCDGQSALLVAPFAGQFRSTDGGLNWSSEGLSEDLIGVVRRQPGTDRLWTSTNVFSGGAWVLGYSDDFGESWAPHLEQYGDVGLDWGCPADSDTATQCAGLCPGLPPGATCTSPSETHAAPPPAPACPGSPPATHLAVDAGVSDAEVMATPALTADENGAQDCTSSPGPAPALLILIGAVRRRPRTQPQSGDTHDA